MIKKKCNFFLKLYDYSDFIAIPHSELFWATLNDIPFMWIQSYRPFEYFIK